ncbi:hypothetical protein H4R35_002949 [Dimargaris xerosporica]|nr:hypothetical protein H4R35_002949 [Dimargaris xerosporica]
MTGKVSALVDKFSREPEHKENEVTRKARDVISQQPNKASDLINRFNQLGVSTPSTALRQTPQYRSISAKVTGSLSAASPPKPAAARPATPPTVLAEPKHRSPIASPAATPVAIHEPIVTNNFEAVSDSRPHSPVVSQGSSSTPEGAIPAGPIPATATSPPQSPHSHPSDKECSSHDNDDEDDGALAAYAEDEITNDPMSYYENITTSPSRHASPAPAAQSIPAADREADAMSSEGEPYSSSQHEDQAIPKADEPNESHQDELAAAAIMLDAMKAELVLSEDTKP